MSRLLGVLILIPTSIAFVFFLLTCLSPAIIPSISMAYIIPHDLAQLHIRLPNSTNHLTDASYISMGIFGVCYYGPSVSFLTNAPPEEITNGEQKWCTPPTITWTLDPGWFVGLESGLGYDPEVQKSVSQSLNGAMGAFNLLGTATAGLAVLISLIMVCLGERNGYEFWFIVNLKLISMGALFAWIALALNVAFVISTADRIKDHTKMLFNSHVGKALWLEAAVTFMISLINCFARSGEVADMNV